ncbi:MAG: aminoacyl-histidine dipeptidase [Rikenellaceae bacterium]
MATIRELEPKNVWTIFDEITKIPRPSKKEEKIRAYLREFAAKHSLEIKEDAKGNIVIRKEATPGRVNHTPVILQSHVDMVCEKDSGSTHNFETDPIETYIEDGWVKARGTTLGADCGIGMALQMAVLCAEGIEHPAIEALFTVDEEMGLTGAMELGEGMLTYKRMINLDSEDEGEIFIGCAGGIDTLANYEIEYEDCAEGATYYNINIGGLRGGHSGDDINKGRANANKVLGRMLWLVTEEFGARICTLDGGNLRNAIARDSSAVVAFGSGVDLEAMEERLAGLAVAICDEYSVTEPDIEISFESDCMVEFKRVFAGEFSRRVLRAVLGVPCGVIEQSFSMPGLVETSTNLASIKVYEGELEVVTSQRSSVQSARDYVASGVAGVFALSGARVRHSDGYPGWKPNPDSVFVQGSARLYYDMFGEEAKVKAIHAGLECGLFLENYPDLDIISVGPTLRDVHSPSERLEIASLAKTWDYLLGLLSLE